MSILLLYKFFLCQFNKFGSVSNPLIEGGESGQVHLVHFHEQIICVEKTAAFALDALDSCIGRLYPAGVDAVADAVYHLVELVRNPAGKAFHLTHPRFYRHANPAGKLPYGISIGCLGEDKPELFLEQVGCVEFPVERQQLLQFPGVILVQSFPSLGQMVFFAGNPAPLRLRGMGKLRPPYLVHHLVHVAHQVEGIVADLHMREMFDGCGPAGVCAVNTQKANGRFLLLRQALEKGFQCIAVFPLGHVERLARPGIDDKCDKAMGGSEVFPIHKDAFQTVKVRGRQASFQHLPVNPQHCRVGNPGHRGRFPGGDVYLEA